MQVVGAGSKAGNLLPSEADGGIRGDGCSIDACWVSGLRDWTLRTVQSATQPRLDWCGELGRASAEEFARLIACSVASDEGEAVTLRSQRHRLAEGLIAGAGRAQVGSPCGEKGHAAVDQHEFCAWVGIPTPECHPLAA